MLFRQFMTPVFSHRWAFEAEDGARTCEACGLELTAQLMALPPETRRLAIPTCPGKRPTPEAKHAGDTDQNQPQ